MAIITISRGTYSGGRALAESLGTHLGYRVTSREALLAEAAAQFDASEEELEHALLHRPGFLERRRLGRLHYIRCLEAALARAAQGDDLVYHGQAGQLLLRGVPHHLRLLVVADMEYRIAASRKRDLVTRRQAVRLIEDADKARDEWVTRIYGEDRDDLATYDLVINLQEVPIPDACDIVAQMVENDFPTTPESQEIMDNLVLASEIRARIGLDEEIEDDKLEVSASHGRVTVSGKARTRHQATRVEELVRQMPGVVEVECHAGAS
jgi:cytidylate kinase